RVLNPECAMARWSRRLLSVMLVGVLLVGVGCGTEGDSPLAPSGNGPQAALIPTVIGTVGSVGSSVLTSVDLLTCTSLPYTKSSATIGPEGGTLRVGTSTLVVPRGALAKSVTITGEQISGKANSVRFSPEGLRFSRPAALTMSYANCLLIAPAKQIVYTSEALKVLEVLKSLDLRLSRTVSSPIDHFSRYAIAY